MYVCADSMYVYIMYVCVSIYVCVYVYMCVYVCVYVSACKHACLLATLHVCVFEYRSRVIQITYGDAKSWQ